MFAVPGWNISTTVKPQAKPTSVDVSGPPQPTEAGEDVPKPASKKDKKKGKRGGLQITGENVADLFEKVIEAKTAAPEGTEAAAADPAAYKPATKKKDDSDKKKRKREDGEKKEQEHKKKKTLKEKKRELKARQAEASGETTSTTTAAAPTTTEVIVPKPAPKLNTPALTPLQQKMRAKLTSARFRHINEFLYTEESQKAFAKFAEEPEMFDEYHAGFRQQVEVWPENPVDIFLETLRLRSKLRFEKGDRRRRMGAGVEGKELPLPKDEDLVCTVADLGCGDAKIAQTVMNDNQLAYKKGAKYNKGKINVLSYDLRAANKFVTACDIAKLPLEDESVDIAIFCLALMGTNFLDFIEEAFRVLRWGGELWVAEIKSRFSTSGLAEIAKKKNEEEEQGWGANKGRIGVLKKGQNEADREVIGGGNEKNQWKGFVDALARRGFILRGEVDSSNKMFVRMEFVKAEKKEWKKNAEESEDEEDRRARFSKNKKKTKFLEETEAMVRKREAALLKPCVYKLR